MAHHKPTSKRTKRQNDSMVRKADSALKRQADAIVLAQQKPESKQRRMRQSAD